MALIRLTDRLTKFLMIFGAVWAFVLCFFILADIIFRALNMPVSGTKEIVANSVVMIVFMQVGFAVRSQSMLRADYDLGAAWDAMDFDMFQWKTDEGEASATAAIFDDLAPEWLETAATGFGNIPFAAEAADWAADAVAPLVDMITPDMPDIHALV